MKKNWLHIFLSVLLLCLLMAASPAMASERTEKAKTKCDNCLKITDFIIIGYIPTPISSKPDPVAHWAEAKCKTCGNIQQFVLDDDRRFHTGGTETPTCTTGKTCEKCGGEYGILGHKWGETWSSSGDNKTHYHTCQRDGCDAIDTPLNCSGDSTATCVTLGTCTTCGGEYYGDHNFDRDWASDDKEHWHPCLNGNCTERKDTAEHYFIHGTVDACLKSKATCVSPAVYYENCASCLFKGTNTYSHPYYGPDPTNHDIKRYTAQAPTCTDPGWAAYEACQREGCGYSTYAEIPASGHSLTHHAAKAPTCTEIGWEAYDTCSHCDYTTYAELPALGHDYQDEIIPRTCEDDGCTLHTCTRCADRYADTIIPHCGHWYGEWTANGDGTQRAECLRGGCHHEKTVDCEIIELPALNISLCPVCGTVSDGSKLALASASVKIISGRIPHGEALLRVGTLASGEKLLTLGYVYGGQLSKASCQVKLTLPAELVNGCTLSLLNADGTETAVDCTVDGDFAVFTLTFAQPLLAVRLTPAP